MPRPPPTISSQSRKKLKAFQFQPDQLDNEDKENAEVVEDRTMSAESGCAKRGTSDQQPLCRQDQTNWPQTPGRIPFSDLIANPEDALSRIINATPVDQVEWRNGPGSSQPSGSARLAQQRRKRARSSTPTSQSQAEKSKHFAADKHALDLESIGRSLRTPKHEDPLSLLWANYAGNLAPDDLGESILPPLPPMSSSPNGPATSKKDGLRRTASCGIEWPTSSSKKRRLDDRDPYSRAKGIFAVRREVILAKSATTQSRVSVLVDSIHQSLLKKAASETNAPSSSSPLPERHADFQRSPLAKNAPLRTIFERCENVPEKNTEGDKHCGTETSSEFGDMDLDPNDPDLLDALQAATQAPVPAVQLEDYAESQKLHQAPSEQKPGAHEVDERLHGGEYSSRATYPFDKINAPRNKALLAKRVDNSGGDAMDDFDNFDDDDFTTELAELAGRVDSQGITNIDGTCDFGESRDGPYDPSMQAIDNFDDAFDDDDDDIDDILVAADEATIQPEQKQVAPGNKRNQDNRTIKRYLIENVFESRFKTPEGRHQPEKVLSIKDEKVQQIYLVCLRQSWYETRCMKGSYIHLIGEFDQYGKCVVNDEKNMVILHPDHLISATTVADSFSCERRATLQDRIKATSPAKAPQVYGHLLHEVFGEALRQNQWDSYALRQIVQKLIPSYLESLYEINVTLDAAVEYVMSKMPELMAWASVFVTAKLDLEATIRDRNGAVVPMAIDKLLELEEHVWSPMYGLKGNIDATVQIQMLLPGETKASTLTVPFELKTGQRDSNAMHRAQTALYTLLLSDRYDIDVTTGILYYLEKSTTFRIEGVPREIKDMIIQRNKLAGYAHDKLALPPMVNREQLCKSCFAQTPCFIYHKLMEDGNGETSGMKNLFTDAVGHLKESQQLFFKKWDDLLTKEERDAMKFKRELWTMLSTEREAVGRCFSNVVIEPGSAMENSDAPKINRYTYTFVKHRSKAGFSFTESQITAGEPIVISDERGHFALANGFVLSIRPTRITVAVDRRLQNTRKKQPNFDPANNQVFSAIMSVNCGSTSSTLHPTNPDMPTLYRIDKDEFQNGMAVARNNVIRIMEKDLWRARELRQLIIDHRAPTFKEISTAYTLSGPASQQDLNIDQRKAIEKVMSAKDYALILGMPGTGKTTTIAHIIRALVSQGKSVLLTSYTHTAVDNILLKIRDDNIPILRLGSTGKVHPDVASFADLGGIPKQTMAELEASWTKSKVVATTCLGINHAIFNHRAFDYCIVDEASQITLPVCLGPIRLASTFILVGDHYQLPPLVQNKEAQEGGLDISLFKLLSDAQPSSVVNLEHQYRMAEDIMLLSNTLIYDGRLKCGTSRVASRSLKIPNLSTGLEAYHHTSSTFSRQAQSRQICVQGSTPCWLQHAIDPQHRALFLNTDTISRTSELGAPELVSGHGTRITNQLEASLVAQLLAVLVKSGVSPKNIGVITFYRSQLALLRTTVKSQVGSSIATDLEMHTADKYQGRDKEVILLSCVRSNDAHHVGELLKDWRRVNVALTRAQSKLLIIGSQSTLGGSSVPVLEGLTKIMRQKNWVLDLPENVLELHCFEPGVQTQTQPRSRPDQELKVRGGDAGKRGDKSRNEIEDLVGEVLSSTATRVPLAGVSGNRKRAGSKIPKKVVKGGMDVDRFLDRHPLIRDVVEDGGGPNGRAEPVWITID